MGSADSVYGQVKRLHGDIAYIKKLVVEPQQESKLHWLTSVLGQRGSNRI